jgi:hypothetical protein
MTKFLVFTEGTVLMHKTALEASREERVKQSINGDQSVDDFASYIPNGSAAEKLSAWREQGADIHYLTSRTKKDEIEAVRSVLARYNFPQVDQLHHRVGNQTYADVAEEVLPDILIEDDCESIGGITEMTYPHIKPALKTSIESIVVKEFEGIDHLPSLIADCFGKNF